MYFSAHFRCRRFRPSITGSLAALILTLTPGVLTDIALASGPTVVPRHAPTSYLPQAKAMYRAHRYAEASNLFWQAIQIEGAGAGGYLSMAHCQYFLGNIKQAVHYYQFVSEHCRGSSECNVARQYLAKLDPNSTIRNALAGATPGGPPTTTTATAANSANLVDHIEIVRPVVGHPEVSALTINTIKEDLKLLPPSLLHQLSARGVKICLTTTLIDKFPALGYQEGRGYDGHTYKSCPGMFKDGTLIICQSVVDEASNEVMGQISAGELSEVFKHEIGHALDACLGSYSTKDDYRHVYYLDMANIPPDAAARLAYYMQKSTAGQQESCAEITAVCLGSGGRTADDIRTHFPLTMAFIKKKLSLGSFLN